MKFYEDGEYRASKDWPYAISAGCVVYRRNSEDSVEVLLLVRDNDHRMAIPTRMGKNYNLPKGHIGLEETISQAAKRETEEEAGVKIKLQTYLGSLNTDFIHPAHDMKNQKTIHYFAAEWIEDAATMDSEHSRKVWHSIAEAIELVNNYKGEEEVIKRLKKFLEVSDDL